MRFYSFFNSSTSWRVRIALDLKGLAYECVPVNIRVGDHRAADYVAAVNPSASVPALEWTSDEKEITLGQSLAIIDYLDSHKREPQLIPQEPLLRARVLEFSYLIACDMHPVNNLRVLNKLHTNFGAGAVEKSEWYHHWLAQGFAGVERLLARHGAGPFCFGNTPTLADCCLIPKIANARRMGYSCEAHPLALAVFHHAMTHAAFSSTAPEHQPDFVK